MIAGPIAFLGLGPDGAISARDLDQRPGRTQSVKILAVVAARTRVTVTVDPAVADRLALSYDPHAFDSRRVADGQRRVVFEACPGGPTRFDDRPATQFNGGVIVEGHRCGRLQIEWNGMRRRISFSLGKPCP